MHSSQEIYENFLNILLFKCRCAEACSRLRITIVTIWNRVINIDVNVSQHSSLRMEEKYLLFNCGILYTCVNKYRGLTLSLITKTFFVFTIRVERFFSVHAFLRHNGGKRHLVSR